MRNGYERNEKSNGISNFVKKMCNKASDKKDKNQNLVEYETIPFTIEMQRRYKEEALLKESGMRKKKVYKIV